MLADVVMFENERVTLTIAYLDAFDEGFELRIAADCQVPYRELSRSGETHPDVFGRHWPRVGEPNDVLPAELLCIGVRFADGRLATNITGHDQPASGPVLWPLGGRGRGSGQVSSFSQGYWVSPQPLSGTVSVFARWPAVGVPLVHYELDAGLIHAGARRSRVLFGDAVSERDGRRWRLGTQTDADWIVEATVPSPAITALVPRGFTAYATLGVPEDRGERATHEAALLELLVTASSELPWWLGYLDTGAHDVVFPYADRVTLYSGWRYVLVEARPELALIWRRPDPWRGTLPDLMFPGDRSWLISYGWDDEWRSLGGSEALMDAIVGHPILGPHARRVAPDEHASPPGRERR